MQTNKQLTEIFRITCSCKTKNNMFICEHNLQDFSGNTQFITLNYSDRKHNLADLFRNVWTQRAWFGFQSTARRTLSLRILTARNGLTDVYLQYFLSCFGNIF